MCSMPLNKRQRENTAKYLYDSSKIVLTIAVISNIFSERMDLIALLLGSLIALNLYWAALRSDGMENTL